jgi:hypothetical protein
LFFSKPAQKPWYVIPKVWSNQILPYQIAGAVIPLYLYTIRPVWIGLYSYYMRIFLGGKKPFRER